nr:TspO/MBR family protein [uncultured Rhodopila sp.]
MTWAVVVAVVWGVLVGGAGAALTNLSSWYHDVLIKPSWQPPDWLFGPAWTLILALASWSLYLGLKNAPGWGSRALILGLFALNGVANLGWSPLFFRLQRPDWALWEVPLLWLAILVPMLVLRPISGTASLLLVPYLCWVSFAAFLNWTIVRINPPFGA